MVTALDLQLDGHEFDSRLLWVVLGRVNTIWANHLGISPSHLSHLILQLYAECEMSTGQSAVMLCG